MNCSRAARGRSTKPQRLDLLLNEPTTSLGIDHELAVPRLTHQACADDVGVLAMLRDINLATHFADRAALLHDGTIIADRAPDAVRAHRRPL